MLALALAVGVANAQTSSSAPYNVLADFNGATGDAPGGNLVMDSSGNLYGVTSWGGNMPSSGNCLAPPYGCGVVFEVSPSSGGPKMTDIYKFSGPDGSTPGGGLVRDKSGNLYGVAAFGGDGICPGENGCGVVYELSPGSGGSWTEKVLYQFQGAPDGQTPIGTLAFGKNGNLYGVTQLGGSGGGVAFELSPASGGAWTENTIYTFTGAGQPGQPDYGLISDKAGNLYGVTSGGDENGVCGSESIGCGLVYELSPNGSGEWTVTVIFTFDGTNGFRPTGNLIFDTAGNLYGTTADGGDLSGCNFGGGCGLVYELMPAGGGKWTEKLLHAFLPGSGGNSPFGGVTMDSSGNLYGTTLYGGASNNGVVFRLTKPSSGRWPETVLHSFTGGTDGGQPESQLLLNAAGTLFGTAQFGGITSDCTATFFAGCGVVFEMKK
jgi:uncharacterized repeat protein (TIGR03803 family)